MTSELLESESTNVAISDPGEKDRAEHNWGDRLMIQLGNIMAWIFPILMIAIVTQVIIRKSGHNQAWLDDGQWWLYGITMLTAFGYAITTDSHVRVDIFHQHYSREKKARLEVFALGWLLLPFIGIMIDIMTQYGFSSFIAREGSDSPNGLHRLYLLKLCLPVLFIFSAMAACSILYRNLARFTTPHVWKILIGALPFFWFLAERLCHYVLIWYLKILNPDMPARKIAKEPLLENSTLYGLVLLVLIFIIAIFMRRKPVSGV